MNESEARIFLAIEQGEDYQDAFEEQMFQHKQFFTSRPIIWATFQAKMLKLKKIEIACEVLNVIIPTPSDFYTEEIDWSENILNAFQQFQNFKSKIFQLIHVSLSPSDLNYNVELLLDVHSKYCQLWPNTGIEEVGIVLSKESDPMVLLAEIKMMQENGIMTFGDLKKYAITESNLIVKESMRLYLLTQKEVEWKKI